VFIGSIAFIGFIGFSLKKANKLNRLLNKGDTNDNQQMDACRYDG